MIETRANAEDKLLARARAGGLEAFEALLRNYEKPLYNLACRILRNREDAADALQEASFKAYRALSNFKGKSSFGTWFYRIVANQCLMKIRQRKNQHFSLDTSLARDDGEDGGKPYEIPDWSTSPAACLSNLELKEKLEKSISELPPLYRVPFVMYEIDDLPVREISQVLEISEPAVKTRLHRGRMILRGKLSDYFEHQKNGK